MHPPIEKLITKEAIHRSVYADSEIFDLEMERIFNKVWVYLGHSEEIREEGDYKTTYVGRHPIIVSRLADGSVTALINRCRHRGPIVCQHELGNSKYFRCPYHSWTYNNAGDLIGVPMPQGYGRSFDKSALGLAKVPRVAEYQGFIFGCMSEEGPTLKEYLGESRSSWTPMWRPRRPGRSSCSKACKNAPTTATGSTSWKTASIRIMWGRCTRARLRRKRCRSIGKGPAA